MTLAVLFRISPEVISLIISTFAGHLTPDGLPEVQRREGCRWQEAHFFGTKWWLADHFAADAMNSNWAKNPTQHVTLCYENRAQRWYFGPQTFSSNPLDPLQGVSQPLIATFLGPGFSADPWPWCNKGSGPNPLQIHIKNMCPVGSFPSASTFAGQFLAPWKPERLQGWRLALGELWMGHTKILQDGPFHTPDMTH